MYIGGPTSVVLLLWSAVTEGPVIWGDRPLPPAAAATLESWRGTPAGAGAQGGVVFVGYPSMLCLHLQAEQVAGGQ